MGSAQRLTGLSALKMTSLTTYLQIWFGTEVKAIGITQLQRLPHTFVAFAVIHLLVTDLQTRLRPSFAVLEAHNKSLKQLQSIL